MNRPEAASPQQITVLNQVAELAVRKSTPNKKGVRGANLPILGGNTGEHVAVTVEGHRVYVNHHESNSEHAAVVTDPRVTGKILGYAGTGKHSTPPQGGEIDPNKQLFTAEAAEHLISKLAEAAQLDIPFQPAQE